MPEPKTVSIGIVGLGSAGMLHVKVLVEGQVPGAVLRGVVASSPRYQEAASLLPSGVEHFESLSALLSAQVCDAVIIATPHPLHPEQTIAALTAGCHVLCEKPAGIRSREAREMAATAQKQNRLFALNYNRRATPLYQRLRFLIQSGEIGALRRINWTSTSWLRVQSYFDSSPWRGTWAGEGGGLLANQWPHILDLWQWIFGMPVRLRATCRFGAHHAIEVEDEVHVFAEYENGATAFLTGSTGEAPGSERVEVVGTRGRIVVDGDLLQLFRLGIAVPDFIASAQPGFPRPNVTIETETLDGEGELAAGITRNFVAGIQNSAGPPLIAPGAEGVAGLMLANAILLSAWSDQCWIPLPLDHSSEALFEHLLARRIASSAERKAASSAVFGLEDSFRRA